MPADRRLSVALATALGLAALPTPTAFKPPIAPVDPPPSLQANRPHVAASPRLSVTAGSRVWLPFAARRAAAAQLPARVWGTHFAMEWDPTEHALDVSIEPPRLAAAGIGSVRTNMYWRDVEPIDTTPDRFDWSGYDARLAAYSAAGRDVVVTVVAYPRWAMVYSCGYGFTSPAMAEEWRSFIGAAAARYRDAPYRVVAWEIGNEVDGKTTLHERDHARPPDWGGGEPAHQTGGCWGDRVEAYVEFLRIAHDAIRAADPTAFVTFGNLAYADVEARFHMDFLDRFLALGGAAFIDYAGFHWFPDVRGAFPTEPPGPELLWRFSATLRRHGVGVPVWLTETNRLTQQGDPALEPRQVQYLTQLLPEMLAAAPIARVYWYAWGDFPGQAPGFWQRGLIRDDRTPKPAMYALPTVQRFTDGVGTIVRRDEAVVALAFRRPRALARHVIAWSADGRARSLRVPIEPGETATLTTLPLDELAAGRCCPSRPLPAQDGYVDVPLRAESSFVEIVARP